jgi:hypothetical protein
MSPRAWLIALLLSAAFWTLLALLVLVLFWTLGT